jgi:hypothetical protein
MPAYDRNLFDPPAPFVMASLRNPESRIVVPDVGMLLDTGADVSLIPRAAINSLGIMDSGRTYEVIGVDDKISVAQMVQLELLLCSRVFKGQFLLIDRDWGILGRNILNYLTIVLDGPSLTWSEKT